jgi:hypothetical protein
MTKLPAFAKLLLCAGFGLSALGAQTKEPLRLFASAIEQIKSQVSIPIILPTKLPSHLRESVIKGVFGEVRKDGYFISLHAEEIGRNASYLAGFGGKKGGLSGLPGELIALPGGATGMFNPVSCGGSCAPANLWWVRQGVTYQIQVKLGSDSDPEEQKRILVEVFNSSAPVRP